MISPLPDKIPDTLFVVELDRYFVIVSCPITECVFPCYRFDYAKNMAYKAADEMALLKGKEVANCVDFPPEEPFIYDPAKFGQLDRALINSGSCGY